MAVYFPGLKGDFVFDDEPNILLNEAIKWKTLSFENLERVFLMPGGGFLGRPVSMLTFALNYYSSGPDPFNFKLANVFIHLANGLGIFLLTRLILLACGRSLRHPGLTDRDIHWIALGTAAIWLLHPLNVTSVLFVVQRMTSLATLFLVGAAIGYAWGRLRMLDGRRGMPIIVGSSAAFLPLALLSKEIGALGPLYLFLLESIVFRFAASSAAESRRIWAFFAFVLFLPAILVAGYLAIHPEWITGGYRFRDFTLAERLMTEARVVWFYLRLAILPDISSFGLFHDDIAISRGLAEPISTLTSLTGLGALIAGAIALRRRAPMLSLGILWFLLGHSLESTVFPLEIAYEHRNYLPMYGLVLTATYYLMAPRSSRQSHGIRIILLCMAVSVLGMITATRSVQFGNELLRSLMEVEHHPNSPRANYQAGRAMLAYVSADMLRDDPNWTRAKHYFERSAELGPNTKEGLLGLMYLSRRAGKPVEQQWYDEMARRLETTPFAPGDSSLVLSLAKGVSSNSIDLPPQTGRRIFSAALNNPTLEGGARAVVLAAYRDYCYSIGDRAAALEMAYLATLANPASIPLRIDYAALLVAAGKKNEASQQLALASKEDRHRLYFTDIIRLRQAIDDHPGEAPNPMP
jgi:hypothetical protein